jgi:hypothetical protein
MRLPTLRFATFLAPAMLPVYAFIARRVQARLGIPTELVVGSSYERLSEDAEVSFLCGLAYIELRRLGQPIEPLAAPLLRGTTTPNWTSACASSTAWGRPRFSRSPSSPGWLSD